MEQATDALAGLRKRPVFVDEFKVHLKRLSIAQVRAFQAWQKDHEGDGLAAVLLLVSMSVCDGNGTLLLKTPEDAAGLDFDITNSLCGVIVKLNGLGETADPKAVSPATPEAPSCVVWR
jgi:hypothetical protein